MNWNFLFKSGALLFFAVMFSFPVFFSSCRSANERYLLKQIDTLMDMHEETASLIKMVDTNAVNSSRQAYSDNWKKMMMVIEEIEDIKLVKESEYWNYITLYESKDRQLKKLLRRFNNMYERHKVNETQLKTFRNSVRRDQIPGDSVQYYLEVEGAAVNDLNREAKAWIPEIVVTKNALDSLSNIWGDAFNYFSDIKANEKMKQNR